jgi:hypothetical protein
MLTRVEHKLAVSSSKFPPWWASYACGSSKLNAAESSMQEALSLEGSALHGVVFDRYERPGNERESSTAKIRA